MPQHPDVNFLRFRSLPLIILVLVAVASTNLCATAAVAQGNTCDVGNTYAGALGKLAATPVGYLRPVTAVLPTSDNARLAFQRPSGQAARSTTFRVFRVSDSGEAARSLVDVLVLSAQNALAADDPNAREATILTIQLDWDGDWLWPRHDFLVVGCTGTGVDSWARTSARVSNQRAPVVACAGVTLVLYLLAMAAVRASSRTEHPLGSKYPAIYGRYRLGLGDLLNPVHLVVDSFNHASVQKFQVLLFSFLVGWLVLLLVLQTGTLVDLSGTVVALMGISGIGAATAQITYREKTRLGFENWAWLQEGGVLKQAADRAAGPEWKDLVLTNREFDVYKLQTIIFTVGVATALVMGGAVSLSSFVVPPGLLGILGLSQVVYVGGILVRPPAVADLDDMLTKLRQAKDKLDAARNQKTDTDAAGTLLDTLPAGGTVAANARSQYVDLANRAVPMIESTLEVPVDKAKLLALADPLPAAAQAAAAQPATTAAPANAGS